MALCLLAALGAPPLLAEEGCGVVAAALPQSRAEREQALRQLELHAAACLRDADWHAQRGALLLALDRVAEAAEQLERAILLAPEHAGARVDYADALALLGDLDSARALAVQLLAQPAIPAAARDHLQARLQAWRQPPPPRWALAGELGAGLAWESNLNGGPADSSIWLTLPEGPVRLPLLPGERPQSGFAAIYDARLDALRPLDDQRHLRLRGQLRQRDAAGWRSDYQLAQFDAGLVQARGEGETALLLSYNEQHFGRARLLGETRLLAQRQWQAGRCAPSLGAEYALRRFHQATVLDGDQQALRAGVRCAEGRWQLDTQLRFALDRPQEAGRPGGRQQWAELRLAAGWQGERHGAALELYLGHVGDRDGYSPLLDDGRVRDVHRHWARAELTRVLDRRWSLAVSIDHFRQRSNLALFDIDNLGLYFGARYRY